ncbi:MAG TPA: hypothetical protein VKB26_15145 [Candidatus Acidoferrales bacterium]|nr:hypothetical protein [Candidatus Acidoferrales bacterium]
MNRAKEFLRITIRTILLVALAVFAGFWLIFICYVAVNFFQGGVHAVQNWLVHISYEGSWPKGPPLAHWGRIIGGLLEIAAVTVLLFVVNLRVLKTFLRDTKASSRSRPGS